MKKFLKNIMRTTPYFAFISLLGAAHLYEFEIWTWLLIIMIPIFLGLIIGPVIFFVWKIKRSKDYASNPSKSRIDTFMKNRK